jgi:predicted RNA methylase
MYSSDFLKHREKSDAYEVAVMNPPYGYVGSGKTRKAADRLHVQHALKMCPRVVVLARANFLWGNERYQHVMRFARLTRMAVLVHRPSFYGPALLPGQDSARHDFAVFEFQRGRPPGQQRDTAAVEYWTDDWRL